MLTRNFLLLLLLFFFRQSGAQNCTNLGQNPGTAFPVCGSSSFVQTTVPVCGQRLVPTPCLTNGSIFMDKNPYWYKFTCFTAGTLGFLITPKNLRDDYDWQLFDVTNHAPSDIYNDASLFVACNWSGETGKTGASAVGTSLQNCEGGGVPLFSKMPMLQKGHNYLLLVSHFDDLSQSGYSLDFNGGTAVITDTTPGKMLQARSFCDGKRISITFNKNLKCSSLSADGSDFSMSGTSVQISEAISTSCSNGFDLDSVILTLNAPLPPGIYKVAIKKGSDNNTLLDNCDTPIAEGDSMTFSVFSAQPAAIDSIVQPGCAPDKLQLVINGSVRCNSVAADGSDFALAGVPGTVIRGASTVCSGDVTTIIKLQLSKPIYASGTSTVTLQKGSDGNTIINECGLETAAGASVSFATADTVSAAFDYVINYGCKGDVVSFTNNGNIGMPRWKWQFNNRDTSGQQNPVYTYKTFGAQTVQLLVSNGTCSDSASASFTLDNELKAVFTGTGQICPNDLATFTDTSIGKISQWYWDFGNGNTSTERNPQPQAYPLVPANQNIFVTLVVKDNFNCSDTAYKPIKVLYNCYIGVPTAFTPNGDNLNDYLYPVNAWKAKNLLFKVFNRFGQVVFQTEDFTKKWDGTINGVKQNTGTYAWTLQYVDTDTGRPYHLKGTTVLIR